MEILLQFKANIKLRTTVLHFFLSFIFLDREEDPEPEAEVSLIRIEVDLLQSITKQNKILVLLNPLGRFAED